MNAATERPWTYQTPDQLSVERAVDHAETAVRVAHAIAKRGGPLDCAVPHVRALAQSLAAMVHGDHVVGEHVVGVPLGNTTDGMWLVTHAPLGAPISGQALMSGEPAALDDGKGPPPEDHMAPSRFQCAMVGLIDLLIPEVVALAVGGDWNWFGEDDPDVPNDTAPLDERDHPHELVARLLRLRDDVSLVAQSPVPS